MKFKHVRFLYRSWRFFRFSPYNDSKNCVISSSLFPFLRLNTTSSSSKEMAVNIADYGTWKSPISSDLVAKGGIKLTHDIDVDNEGRVFWAELRSTEGGRSVICSWKEGEEDPTQWTPVGFNARTKLNEYGGGAFFVSADGMVFFSNYKDQRLYRQSSSDSSPEPVTEDKAGKYMYADGQYVSLLRKIITVREDHTQENVESKTTIVSIDPETQEQHVLVTGADFYLSPTVSSDGKKISWVEYNHPNMPWDSTEIFLANLNENGTALLNDTKSKVAGTENNSVILPKFSPEGELFYIDDRNNFWNLHQYNQQSGEIKNIVPKDFEIGGPQWVFGIDGYAFGPKESNEIYGYFDNDLGVVNTKTMVVRKIPTTSLCLSGDIIPTQTLVSSSQGELFLVAGTASQSSSLFKFDPTTLKAKNIISTSVDIDEGYISIPEKISFPTSDNATAHGILYLPKNKDYSAPPGQLPPLMVRAHGGPTSSASIVLNLKHQFLTSRGIAVLDVDYRGSTGYGRIYRDALKGKWGIYDVDDVTNGALYLVKSSKVNGNCLSIDGGSAGGYTTLAALTYKSVFQAGISLYGVSDLEALVSDTHKFESRYLDSLIGRYPDAKQIYTDRSPIYHTEKLNSSIAFFQGDEDKVVPPSQAEKMFQVVKEKGFKTAYVLFPGEQHGFREAKNIKRCIDGELYFLSKVFGFAIPDIDVEIEIFNI